MIDINKKYRTRAGREVRIYATDGSSPDEIHGSIKSEYSDRWHPYVWQADGKHHRDHVFDLIEVRPRHKETIYINIYDGYMSLSHSEKAAKDRADCGILARVKVDIDVEEGHGL